MNKSCPVMIKTPVEIDNSALVGDWINVDADTKSITNLTITEHDKNNVSINVWSRCGKEKCESGSVELNMFSKSPADNAMVYGLAVWKIHRANWPADVSIDWTLTIKQIDLDKIHVTTFSKFNDNSKRSNYVYKDILKRVK